jgi:DNA-binding transcriptional ArsR family regulator
LRYAFGVDVFVALADPTRRALLDQLQRDGECAVSELVAAHAVSQPAISRHLRVLREAGLVSVRQDGRRRCYRVDADGLLPLLGYLTSFWDQRFGALAAVLDDLEEES